MVEAQLNTLYNFEPEVVRQVSDFVQTQVRYEALSEQIFPVEQSLEPLTKGYDYWKSHDDIGFGYEMDVTSPPDSNFAIEAKRVQTPVVFSNYSMPYDEFLRVQRSKYSLNDRLADHATIMARRQDIIAYTGDSKHGITAWSGIGTEFGTQLDVSTPALAGSSIATAIGQLKASLKYSGKIGPMSTVILEVTPDVWDVMVGTLVANFGEATPMTVINKALTEAFSANSRVVENHYLDATATIDANGRLTALTTGTLNAMLWVQDPRIVRLLTSPVETRVSPLDMTRGITYQPLRRITRVDIETLGILKETVVKIA